jgi:aspartate kinase
MKFGGTSVGTGELVRHVAQLVDASDDPDPVVVASAMEGVTDTLDEAADRARQDEDVIPGVVDEVRTRHAKALEAAVKDPDLREEVDDELQPLHEKLDRLLYGIAYTEELTDRTRDLVHSFGERYSVRLVAGALQETGHDAQACDADEVGVVTDGRFGNASPRMDAVTRNLDENLRPLVDDDVTPVVTGYFGCDREGHVTTFGRGGSDYSASILAAALGADRLEVWKDVEGFLSADPEMVPDAVPLAHLTYDEAAELAYVGAEVLHPRTVEPVEGRGIPIYVRNTKDPEAEGTVIRESLPDAVPNIRAAAVREGLAILRLYGPGMAYKAGIGQEIFTAMGDEGINVYNMAASQASFAMLIDEADLERGKEILGEHVHGVIQGVDGTPSRSLVTVVGDDLGSTHGVAGDIFTVVGDAGINVEMISVGASAIALNFVIRTEDAEACLGAIHDAFLKENDRPPEEPP